MKLDLNALERDIELGGEAAAGAARTAIQECRRLQRAVRRAQARADSGREAVMAAASRLSRLRELEQQAEDGRLILRLVTDYRDTAHQLAILAQHLRSAAEPEVSDDDVAAINKALAWGAARQPTGGGDGNG